MVAKTVTLPEAWRVGLLDRPFSAGLTCRDLAQCLGCWSYAMYAMREPPAGFPVLLLAARALGRACVVVRDWDRPLSVSDAVLGEYRRFGRWLRHLAPRSVVVPGDELHLWADASDVGGAFLLLLRGALGPPAEWDCDGDRLGPDGASACRCGHACWPVVLSAVCMCFLVYLRRLWLPPMPLQP